MVYRDFLYLEANGDIHPCNVYSIRGIKNFNQAKYKSFDLNIKNIRSFNEALSHSRFELFNKMYKDGNEVQQNLVPKQRCKTCFAKKDCEPCPFQFYADEHFLECEIAYNYFLDLYHQTKDGIITFSEKSVDSMNSLYSKFASKTIEEVVKKTESSASINSIDWAVFERLLKLQKKGFINIEVK